MSRPELWDRAAIAAALGVSVKAVDKWRSKPGSDFPAPAYRFAFGPVWLAHEVRTWRRHAIAARRNNRKD